MFHKSPRNYFVRFLIIAFALAGLAGSATFLTYSHSENAKRNLSRKASASKEVGSERSDAANLSNNVFLPPPTPTLGNYPDTTVLLGANTTVTPDAAPTDTTSIDVATSTDFNGELEGDPTTGVVRVTNAHPAGSYTVTITAFGAGGLTTKTFTLTVASGTACAGTIGFTNAADASVGSNPISNPVSVAIGDFNNDGKQDIAVSNIFSGSNTVSIRLGDGAGGFSGTTEVSVGSTPYSVAVGDFNGDGKQDLAVANAGSNTVSIRLGDGAGGFSGTTEISVGSVPRSVAVGDFNVDGKQDIATADDLSNTVSIRLGDGAGGFSVQPDVSVGGRPWSVAIGDFNNDAKDDIAAANYNSDTVSIRLGDGAGGFSVQPDVSVGNHPQSVAIGDFNNDGKQDFAVSNFFAAPGTVSIRLGDGAGGFSGTTEVTVGSGPHSVSIGDFNNDGKQDFAVATNGTVSIRLGDGAGGFSGGTEVGVSTNSISAAIGDFNHDGKQDFAAANYDSNTVSIRLGQCNPAADLSITKTASPNGTVATSSQITYTITVNNNGPSDAADVSVNDPIPSGTTFSSFTTSQGSCTAPAVGSASPPLNCSLGTINAGSSATITLTVDVTALPGATISNTATVSGTTSDPDAGNNSASTNNSVAGCDLVVTNTNNSGAHSLRLAIQCANANPGLETITFNIPGAGVHTIQPLSILPAITDPVIVDGYSQPGSSPNTLAVGDDAVLQVEIDGSLAGVVNGLTVNPGGAGSTLKGLVINRVRDAGIRLNGGGNRIEGNFIGTNAAGTAALGNGSHGVDLNSSSNVIGGAASASRNIISGNNSTGVSLAFNGNVVQNNSVQGNYIGTNAAGTAALANLNHGVSIGGPSTSGNLIGGASPGAGNVISGNRTEGLQITGTGGGGGPTGTVVQGNLIGTDASGTAAIPNGFRGIFIGNGAASNIVGGTVPGARNIISGNNGIGIFITLSGSNLVQGNYIGTNISGTAALGNRFAGLNINGGANNTIGGLAAGAGNVISGNLVGGIVISGSTSTGNLVQGNFIGTDVTGTLRVANLASSGVSIAGGANNSMIGGTAAGARNIISGNSSSGVIISSGANLNQVQGNYIGTDVTGTFAITNNVSGVFIQGASGPLTTNNLIGGAAAGAGNLISGNTLRGVEINGVTAKANEITANRIGTNASGTGALANNSDGVSIQQGAANNTITGNLVSGNRTLGINLGLNTTATTIQGNLIGTDITGSVAVPNSAGISLSGGTNNNQIGGTTPSARNVISGNTGNGVQLSGSTVTANLIEGNFIGTDISGTTGLGNGLAGVVVISATNTTIGGVSSASRNVISGNGIGTTNPINGSGVVLQTGSNNRVLQNYIGTDVTGNIGLGNTGNGVFVESSINNIVSGNVVSANGQVSLSAGIILSTNANSNQVKGNYIGTNAAGTAPLGNGGNGVLVGRTATSASNNLVGGTAPGDANVIAFNGSNGILVINNNSLNNALRQNSIFSNSALGIDLGTADGVTPNDSCDADSGANNLQNFPVLTSVSTSGGSTTIQGALNSAPSTTFTLEFFANSVGDPSGNGEGQTFIGSTTVTTDASCNAAFTFVAAAAPAGQDFFTATATDPAGNTSEFSASKSFDADLSITKTDSPDPVVVGATLTYSITVNNGGPSTATNASVVDTLPASVIFNSVSSSQGSCTQSAGTVNCNLGTIANGGSATVTITVTPNAAGSITNTATVSANESDSNSANNTATATTTVTQANTSTTVTSSQDPSIYGQSVTFTATVGAVAPGSGIPTGTVTFYDGATVLGTSNVDSSGQANFTTSALFIGTHSITATYNGDANYNGSTSPPLIQTVVAPLSTDDVKVTGGGSIILTTGGSGTFGLVGKVSSAGAPSGNVEFQDHGTGMNAKAKTITSVVVTGTHAQIFGKATINGTGSYDFVVDLDDLGEPGVNDKFRIQLSNGYVAGSATLSGGNIQVHK